MISIKFSQRSIMIKNIYYQGELIPVKDWDYDLNKPKVKKEESKKITVELLPEVQPSLED